jgi:hypothetical protein
MEITGFSFSYAVIVIGFVLLPLIEEALMDIFSKSKKK